MLKKITLAVIVSSLLSCSTVDLKTPKRRTSIAEAKSKEEAVNDKPEVIQYAIFFHHYYPAKEQSAEQANNRCLAKLEQITKTNVATQTLDIQETKTSQGMSGNLPYIECQITVVIKDGRHS